MSEKSSNKNPVGRPSTYTLELGLKVCKAVATTTYGLRKMCKMNPDFPGVDAIFEWRYKYPEFAEQYAQAKRQQADLLAEDILDISDDDEHDYIDSDDGRVRHNNEAINRSRLRVDTRKWIASKLIPKVYGEKLTHEGNVIFNHEQALKELKSEE